MRFFSAALFLAAAGSVIALPHEVDPKAPSVHQPKAEVEIEARSDSPTWVPNWEPSPTAPAVAAAQSSTSTEPEHEHGKDELESHDLEPHVATVIKGVLITVLEVKGLVLKDLALIFKLVDSVEVDVKLLLGALHTLETHLTILLKTVIPKLVALVFKVGSLTEVDLRAVLSLLVEIKAIITGVLACLLHLVATLKAEILALVLSEVQGLLALLAVIVGPIIKLALCAVLGLEATLVDLVEEILGLVADLSKCVLDLGDVLTPVLGKVLGSL